MFFISNYLSPKKVIFFQNIISFEIIEHVEHLLAKLTSETSLKKNSIGGVRCKDERGRIFIVEMQILWGTC